MIGPRGDDPTVADGATSSGDGAELRGRIADRYEIASLVGVGGMGNVYRAIDRELGEPVALKILRRRGDDPAALDRFRDEVKLARRVTHVNVARTHDLGKHGDTLFLTMELVDGEGLGRRLERGPLGWREAVAIGRSICAGVAAAHAAGVVHRDLKPDNVLLARDGRVVVTDFGIAATHALTTDSDRKVEVTGTPVWMAPEQLLGSADARADVYAIGEILWLLMTGAHPWLADGAIEVMSRITATPPRLPRGHLPDAVIAVVERCLARDPGQRPADAGALGDALAAAAAASDTGSVTPRPQRPPAAARDVLVGIEPIRNLGAAEDEFVAVGLAEDLTDVLGRVRGIRIRALAGAAVRDDLDVVVSGSLRRAGELVRITVRATGARDGIQIWSQRFDRRLDEILRVSDEVARHVADALSATAGRPTGGRDATTDQAVVELYLRARHLQEQTWFDDPRPAQLYRDALARDPESPVVLAAYATLLARRANAMPERGVVADAEQLARRAIACGPGLPEPWVALAVVFLNQNRNVAAMRAARMALDLGPALGEAADVAGRMLLEVDPQLDEAVMLLTRARWANPRQPTVMVDLVRALALRGDWTAVDELLRNPGTDLAPALVISRIRAILWRGGPAELLTVTEVPQGLSRFRWVGELMRDAFTAGVLTEAGAATWRERVAALPARTRIRVLMAQMGAELALRVGTAEAAHGFVDEAVDHGLLDLSWIDHMPLFARVRGEAWYAQARVVVESRAAPILAAWRAPLPSPDVDAWA